MCSVNTNVVSIQCDVDADEVKVSTFASSMVIVSVQVS